MTGIHIPTYTVLNQDGEVVASGLTYTHAMGMVTHLQKDTLRAYHMEADIYIDLDAVADTLANANR